MRDAESIDSEKFKTGKFKYKKQGFNLSLIL